ncbi:hypothetical protein ABUW04_37980 [Streptacidiphilus sp. N1-10]|uniref:Uncharacterized protein n=1 Tax=Streptacidiphilus jeojiensis TaxID=3229225 RepID=A0ABV6Y0L6_9ACTN
MLDGTAQYPQRAVHQVIEVVSGSAGHPLKPLPDTRLDADPAFRRKAERGFRARKGSAGADGIEQKGTAPAGELRRCLGAQGIDERSERVAFACGGAEEVSTFVLGDELQELLLDRFVPLVRRAHQVDGFLQSQRLFRGHRPVRSRDEERFLLAPISPPRQVPSALNTMAPEGISSWELPLQAHNLGIWHHSDHPEPGDAHNGPPFEVRRTLSRTAFTAARSELDSRVAVQAHGGYALFELSSDPGGIGTVRAGHVEALQRNGIGVDIVRVESALQHESSELPECFLAQFERMERERVRRLVLAHHETDPTGRSPAQNGASNAYGAPMFSTIPLSGDRLSERTSTPPSQTAKVRASETLCIAWKNTRSPRPAASRCEGIRLGRCPMSRRSQTTSTPSKLAAYEVPSGGYVPSHSDIPGAGSTVHPG